MVSLDVSSLELRGVDFTCAPTRRKAITTALGVWREPACIEWRGLHRSESMPAFEATLESPLLPGCTRWFGGFDLPFGLPRAFVRDLRLGASMDHVIANVHRRCPSRMAFRAFIDAWCATQPPGQRLVHRATDVAPRQVVSTSPLQTRYVPVAWMYFEGVKRLVDADVSVHRMREGRGDAVAVEAYPARLAAAIVGSRSYKNGVDQGRRDVRQALVAGLVNQPVRSMPAVTMSRTLRRACIDDASGDVIDALLALVQAARASSLPEAGLPSSVDPVEGWIVG